MGRAMAPWPTPWIRHCASILRRTVVLAIDSDYATLSDRRYDDYCTRFVNPRNLQNARRNLEIAVAQFANFKPKTYPMDGLKSSKVKGHAANR